MALFSQSSEDNFRNFFINLERQCAKGELLKVRQRFFYDIKKCIVIEITICVHTINSLISIKDSTCL